MAWDALVQPFTQIFYCHSSQSRSIKQTLSPDTECTPFKILANFSFYPQKKTNGSTTNFCTSSPLGARRLTLPVECVGENCVAKADGGGKDVDGRDAGAGHDRGLVPWGREKRAVTDNTQLQTRVEEEISFI